MGSTQNSEVSLARVAKYLQASIPGSGSPPASVRTALMPGLNPEDAKNAVQLLVEAAGGDWEIGNESDLGGTNKTVAGDRVFTEPCLLGEGDWPDTAYVRAVGAGALTPVVTVYISVAPNVPERD